jgi:hypothetical protein
VFVTVIPLSVPAVVGIKPMSTDVEPAGIVTVAGNAVVHVVFEYAVPFVVATEYTSGVGAGPGVCIVAFGR